MRCREGSCGTGRDTVAATRVGRSEAEYVDRLSRRRDAEEGGRRVEGHAEDPRGYGASPELVQLLRVRNREDADDGAFLRSRRQQSAMVVQRYARQGRVVRFYHIHCFHLGRIIYQDFSAGRSYVIRFGWRMGRRLEGSGYSFGGERVDEVVVLGGGGKGAYGCDLLVYSRE